MHTLLITNRLILRRLLKTDADCLFKLDNDPDVMRYINGGIPTPRDIFERDILPAFLHVDERFPRFGFWAAIEKHTREFLGWFSFRPDDNASGNVTLGYRLCKAAWGNGFATEGARALIDKGFAELGVNRVTATTYQDNLGSIRVMEKVGMTLVRRFRLTQSDLIKTDTHHVSSLELWDGDDVEYAIDRAEWKCQQQEGAQ
ncbi:MAG: N-acetyltransferase [Chloroflexi bacterium]|nr:MAG: N-acetyltransferase [Chloroflexota bacterium]